MYARDHRRLKDEILPLNCSGSVTGILISPFFGGIVAEPSDNHQAAATERSVRQNEMYGLRRAWTKVPGSAPKNRGLRRAGNETSMSCSCSQTRNGLQNQSDQVTKRTSWRAFHLWHSPLYGSHVETACRDLNLHEPPVCGGSLQLVSTGRRIQESALPQSAPPLSTWALSAGALTRRAR